MIDPLTAISRENRYRSILAGLTSWDYVRECDRYVDLKVPVGFPAELIDLTKETRHRQDVHLVGALIFMRDAEIQSAEPGVDVAAVTLEFANQIVDKLAARSAPEGPK